MTPRPFYRWKSLWLGIFVASFIVWAWRDSASSSSWISCHQWQAGNAGGGVSIGYKSEVPSAGAASAMVKWGRLDLKIIARVFPTFAPTSFPAPLFLRGEDWVIEQADAEELGRKPFSYDDLLRTMTRTEGREARLLFIPHWLILLAFTLPWSAFLIWRTRRQSKLAS